MPLLAATYIDQTVLISLQVLIHRGEHPAKRGLSSAGRAPDLHSGGQRFDPAILHQETLSYLIL